MGCEKIIYFFFYVIHMIKLYHWQTHSYSRHKASDQLHSDLISLTDEFIEVYMGRYKRPSFPKGLHLEIIELDEKTVVTLLNDFESFLKNELPSYLHESDTDLLNIRDEILGKLDQTKYLFTLE